MAFWNNLYFQDSASPLMAQLHYFHDHIMIVVSLVTILVFYWISSTLLNQLSSRFLLEHQYTETLWTLLPMIILLVVTLPSLRLLYLLDEVSSPEITLKVTGNQWFWSYEYSDFPSLEFDSYMIPVENLKPGLPRLLEVDNRVTLPCFFQIRLLITASDVIHSWTVPALGVKADAVPGRLNQCSTKIDRSGIFYGQCSEICGANHSFMPIVIESVSPKHFSSFVNN